MTFKSAQELPTDQLWGLTLQLEQLNLLFISRLAKETHSQARSGDFKSRLLNMMMILNVGNLAKMSKEELDNLVEQG